MRGDCGSGYRQIEEATCISASRAAQFLRERDVFLWPQGFRSGQEAHVEAHHLVNVVLALAAADPLTGAPEVVAELRDLVPLRDDTRAPGITGDTLGEALDLRVSSLAASKGAGKRDADWWQITLINGPQFHAKGYNPQWLTLATYLPRRFAKIEDMRASLLQREATLKHGLIQTSIISTATLWSIAQGSWLNLKRNNQAFCQETATHA